MSSRRSTAAPPRVPSRIASRADIASPPPRPRATRRACFTSRKRSLRSFEAEPSTPRPTRTPAVSMSCTGATPAPRRRFEVGQCATPVPVLGEPGDIPLREVNAVRAPDVVRQPAEPVEVLDGPAAVELDAIRLFLERLCEVGVKRQAEPAREHGRFLHQAPGHREGGAWCHCQLDARAGTRLVQQRRRAVPSRRAPRRGPRRARRGEGRHPRPRGPWSRARRRSGPRSRAPPAPRPRSALRVPAGRRSGDRTPSCSPTAPTRPDPCAPRHTPPRRRSATRPDRARAAR